MEFALAKEVLMGAFSEGFFVGGGGLIGGIFSSYFSVSQPLSEEEDSKKVVKSRTSSRMNWSWSCGAHVIPVLHTALRYHPRLCGKYLHRKAKARCKGKRNKGAVQNALNA